MHKAKELVEQMRSSCKLDIISYNTLLKGYCNVGDLGGATELLNEMQCAGLAPNDVSYNCLINAAVSAADYDKAWETVTIMQRRGVKVDHYTISILMKAMKKSRHHTQVARALSLLDSTGLDVCSDEVLLNTVVETCTWHKEFDRLALLLANFQSCALRPSAPTYGTLIKAASSLQRVDLCWLLWKQMTEERAMEPSDIVLGCMLDALVCNDCLEAAEQLLRKWKGRVRPNTVIYSTLIKGFANSRQAGRAMEIWKEMRECKVPMNTVAYNALIDAQARVGAMDEVSLLVSSMEKEGCYPDVITFSTIVKGYCVKGDLHKALDVFKSIDKKGVAADAIIFNTILDGCIRHNNMDLADTMVQNMSTFKVIPTNFTLGILVKMYGRRGQLTQAFEVTKSLPANFGFTPNSQVLTCLMCACVNNRDVRRALEVFQQLKGMKSGADAKAYGALLSGCVRHGYLDEAAQVIKDAYGLSGDKRRGLARGENLEGERVEQFFRALSSRGLMDVVGVKLLEQMRAANVPMSHSLLCSGLLSKHNQNGHAPRGRRCRE
jgi:pentatricopeptide repeat protein